MRLIEQAMLLRRYPYGARFYELVRIITALLPDAWRRLTGRMPAQHDLEQALQQHASPTQIELVPESPKNVSACSSTKRSLAVPSTATRPKLAVAPAMPTRINMGFAAYPLRFPLLLPSKQYLSLGSAKTHPDSNPIKVNVNLATITQNSNGAFQCSPLGSYWAQHIQPIMGADGRNLPVYQLRPDQFKLCEELLHLIAPNHFATGAMMQDFGNGRVDFAIRLQCRESLSCGLIAATSSDRAISWDKVALRDENGGPE
jgi:hypothetical protein